MTNEVECWSVILTDQARDVILSTSVYHQLCFCKANVQFQAYVNEYQTSMQRGQLHQSVKKKKILKGTRKLKAAPLMLLYVL